MGKTLAEFKAFAMRGNVIDLAVGVIIGGAFGKIVNSIVSDIILPPIGVLIGGVKFSDLKYEIKAKIVENGKEIAPAVNLNYGNFFQMVFEFIIIAFSIFMMVKMMNRMTQLTKKQKEEQAEAEKTPLINQQEVLLTEIRDLLKK